MNRHAAKKIRAGNRRRRFLCACGWLTAGVLFVSVIQAADSQPENIFARPPVLPPELQRVAVLPLAAKGREADLPDGCAALQPVLFDELVRTEKFEVVSVRPENLRASSGRAAWTGAEQLPKGFFEFAPARIRLRRRVVLRADGVSRLCAAGVGWRLKLVDVRTQKIIWAADRFLMPASRAWRGTPSNSWRQRDKSAGRRTKTAGGSANSPRQFGSYTAAEILSHLPAKLKKRLKFVPAHADGKL